MVAKKKNLIQKVCQTIRSHYDENGREHTSEHKSEAPIKFPGARNKDAELAQSIARELDRRALESGDETYEESQDFEIYEEDDIVERQMSKYEVVALQDEMIADKKYNPYHPDNLKVEDDGNNITETPTKNEVKDPEDKQTEDWVDEKERGIQATASG